LFAGQRISKKWYNKYQGNLKGYMAITPTYLEGFDDGSTVARLGGWTTTASNFGSPTASSITGRGSVGNALRLTTGAQTSLPVGISLGITISSMISSRFVIGVAWRPVSSIVQTNNTPSAISIVGTNTVCVTVSTGYLQLRQGTNASGTLIAQSVDPCILISTWHFIEINVLQGASNTGRVVIRVNGTTRIDTMCSVSGIIGLRLGSEGSSGSGGTNDFDDLMISTCDTSDEFAGDTQIYTLRPNTNGATNQGVGSDGNSTDNYLLVDETTVSTADYVEVASGDRDLYGVQDLPFVNGSVLAVQPRIAAERTQSGAGNIKTVVKLGANETVSADITPPVGSVPYINSPASSAKPGGGAWTIADINSVELGVEAS
jgi:hypothetical protein